MLDINSFFLMSLSKLQNAYRDDLLNQLCNDSARLRVCFEMHPTPISVAMLPVPYTVVVITRVGNHMRAYGTHPK